MKTALIKQVYEPHGSWAGIKWQDTDALKIFDVWPGKPTYWGITTLLEADWYVVPAGKLKSDYIKNIIANHPAQAKVSEKYTINITDIKDIPFDEYDLVVALDPICDVKKNQKTLFTYIVQEDWDTLYAKSLRRPLENYDLFLDFMMTSKDKLEKLPQAVSFPFLYNFKAVHSVFQPSHKKEAVWAEWRLLAALGMTSLWNESAEKAAKRLEQIIGMPVLYKGNFVKSTEGVFDPPLWRDSVSYFEEIGECKYYLAVGRYAGPGQALCEAASLGNICIGEANRAYHRMVCHPECLCKDMLDMPKIIKKIVFLPGLQKEILEYQKEALENNFAKKPVALLQQAIEMKRVKN